MMFFAFLKRGDKYSRLELTIYAGCWLLLFGLPLIAYLYEANRGEHAYFQWQDVWGSFQTLFPMFLLFLLNNFVLLPMLFLET